MGVEVRFSFMEVRHTYKNDGTLVYTNARNICTFDASKYENDYLEGLFTKKVDYDFYINETTYKADKYGAALMACTDIDAFVEACVKYNTATNNSYRRSVILADIAKSFQNQIKENKFGNGKKTIVGGDYWNGADYYTEGIEIVAFYF
jgi:hypothetical protein